MTRRRGSNNDTGATYSFKHVPLPPPGSALPYIPPIADLADLPEDIANALRSRVNCACSVCQGATEPQAVIPPTIIHRPSSSSPQYVQSAATPSKASTIARNLAIYFFLPNFVYKLFQRVNPISALGSLISDTFSFLFMALSWILWPLKLFGAIPGWLSGQVLAFFKDLWAACGFIPVFASLALRLAGAYVLVQYVVPFLYLLCITLPMDFLRGRSTGLEESTRRATGGDAAVGALMLLLAERQRLERAQERQSATNAGRGGRKSKHRRQT